MKKYSSIVAIVFFFSSLVTLGWQVWRIDYLGIFKNNSNETQIELTAKDWENAMVSLDQNQSQPALDYIAFSRGNQKLASRRALLEGRLMLSNSKPRAAEQAFAEALVDSNIRPLALYWLGAATYAIGNPRMAANRWLEAIAARPDLAPAHRSLSMYFYDLGASDNAVFHLSELAKLEPKDGRPLRLLGLVYKDNERYEDAVVNYRQALQRQLSDTSRQEVLVELTDSLLKTRNYQEALEAITQCTESNDVRVLKAECLAGLGKNEEAIQELDLVLAVAPDHLRALLQRGTLELESGNIEAAIGSFSIAAKKHPMDYTAHFKLSQALRRGEKNEEADKEAAEADRIRIIREKFAELHQQAAAKPEDASLRFELGKTALALQMDSVAENWYRAALQMDPKFEPARDALRQFEAKREEKGAQTPPASPPSQ